MLRFPDDAPLGAYVADALTALLKKKPTATICIAAGTSSFPVFEALKGRVQAGELDLSQASFFAMDEWCGLPQDADGAMADFLHRYFLNDVDFAHTFLFDGMADPEAECVRAEAFLAEHGGLDAVVFGIGVNGHVALNEPGVDPALRTHVAQVDPVTAAVAQKYFRQEAPLLTKGITMGIANASEADMVFLVANTKVKRTAVEAINTLATLGIPNNEVPASFIAALPQAEFLVTEAVFAE